MKKTALIMFVLCLAGLSAAQAQTKETNLRFFSQLEFWSRGGAFDALPVNAGQELNVSPAVGFRAGFLMMNPSKKSQVGASVGYVFGPWAEWTDKTGNFGSQKTFSVDLGARFLRFLVEAYKEVPLGRRLFVKIGGGAGVARGRMSHKQEVTGYQAELYQPFSDVQHWTGLTWEVMPALVIPGKSIDVELGVGYAHFPSTIVSEGTSGEGVQFKWNPIGAKVALRFF